MDAADAARLAGENEVEAYRAAYERAPDERHERLKRDACASSRAMQGWSKVLSDEHWGEVVLQA